MGLSPQALIMGKKRSSFDGGLLTGGMAIMSRGFCKNLCSEALVSSEELRSCGNGICPSLADSEAQFAECLR